DANAYAEYGPLLERSPGEDVAGLPGVDADAGGRLVEQPADDVEPGPEGLERFEALAEFHRVAGALRVPVLGANAVAHEQDGDPLRGCRGVRSRRPRAARECLQPRQRNRDANSTQEGTPGEGVGLRHIFRLRGSVLQPVPAGTFSGSRLPDRPPR